VKVQLDLGYLFNIRHNLSGMDLLSAWNMQVAFLPRVVPLLSDLVPDDVRLHQQ